MVDRASLEKSLQSVREAHRVLESFHREVAGFYQILDEHLGDGDCGLTPHNSGSIVTTMSWSMRKVEDWVPTWLGRLYYDAALQVGEGEEETLDSRSAAMVAIVAVYDEVPPHCWFGFGRPGDGTKYTESWGFARNGLWNYGYDPPPVNSWADGTFTDDAKLGAGGTWHFRRTPLIELTSPERVRELVAVPLLQRWKLVMRQAKQR